MIYLACFPCIISVLLVLSDPNQCAAFSDSTLERKVAREQFLRKETQASLMMTVVVWLKNTANTPVCLRCRLLGLTSVKPYQYCFALHQTESDPYIMGIKKLAL